MITGSGLGSGFGIALTSSGTISSEPFWGFLRFFFFLFFLVSSSAISCIILSVSSYLTVKYSIAHWNSPKMNFLTIEAIRLSSYKLKSESVSNEQLIVCHWNMIISIMLRHPSASWSLYTEAKSHLILFITLFTNSVPFFIHSVSLCSLYMSIGTGPEIYVLLNQYNWLSRLYSLIAAFLKSCIYWSCLSSMKSLRKLCTSADMLALLIWKWKHYTSFSGLIIHEFLNLPPFMNIV